MLFIIIDYLAANSYSLSPRNVINSSLSLANEPGMVKTAFEIGKAAMKSKQLAKTRHKHMKLFRCLMALKCGKKNITI